MSKKHQATSSKLETTIRILHEEWALKQGMRPKHQATSIKRQAASVDAEIYNDSDYKARSVKRQALTEIPHN